MLPMPRHMGGCPSFLFTASLNNTYIYHRLRFGRLKIPDDSP